LTYALRGRVGVNKAGYEQTGVYHSTGIIAQINSVQDKTNWKAHHSWIEQQVKSYYRTEVPVVSTKATLQVVQGWRAMIADQSLTRE